LGLKEKIKISSGILKFSENNNKERVCLKIQDLIKPLT